MGLIVCVALVGPIVALWLLFTGQALAAVVIALVAFTLAALFAAEAREALLHGPVTRAARTAAVGSREQAAFAATSAAVWSRSRIELGRLRSSRRRLERQAAESMRELGEAVCEGDSSRVQVARARASAANTLRDHLDRTSERVRADARARIAARR
jgi:hypothetical protein